VREFDPFLIREVKEREKDFTEFEIG